MKRSKIFTMIQSVLVLTVICVVIAGALALTNSVTGPVIEKARAARQAVAELEVLPDADGFEELTIENLPESVQTVYRATNGVGYIIKLETKGYDGPIVLLCGLREDGTITATKTLIHSETVGLGAKIADEPFRDQFVGKDESLEGVSMISGATVSSKAYLKAIADAFTALERIKEGG